MREGYHSEEMFTQNLGEFRTGDNRDSEEAGLSDFDQATAILGNESPALANTLRAMDREHMGELDKALNMNSLSWMSFRQLDSGTNEQLIQLLSDWPNDREGQKKNLGKIIELVNI